MQMRELVWLCLPELMRAIRYTAVDNPDMMAIIHLI